MGSGGWLTLILAKNGIIIKECWENRSEDDGSGTSEINVQTLEICLFGLKFIHFSAVVVILMNMYSRSQLMMM